MAYQHRRVRGIGAGFFYTGPNTSPGSFTTPPPAASGGPPVTSSPFVYRPPPPTPPGGPPVYTPPVPVVYVPANEPAPVIPGAVAMALAPSPGSLAVSPGSGSAPPSFDTASAGGDTSGPTGGGSVGMLAVVAGVAVLVLMLARRR